eukprot:NODE_15076_length_414_cov_1.240418_g15053_i0.p1 GENE.NODE_15076_length_414_cov_1.240418_g15053_i0~~NODE_15076_length_414_cov_1.240418_g15053_i0.p1  ORF type:complete len:107 (+),score=4.23 NODE_15076_length_414_cov_1.240418_g15053_i0:61-381(+)
MHGGTDEQGWPRPSPVDDMDRQMHRRVVRQHTDRDIDCLARARGNRNPANDEIRPFGHQPLPFVLVLPAFARASICSMILPATSMPVAFSTPSSPGEEFTSITTGP